MSFTVRIGFLAGEGKYQGPGREPTGEPTEGWPITSALTTTRTTTTRLRLRPRARRIARRAHAHVERHPHESDTIRYSHASRIGLPRRLRRGRPLQGPTP